MMMERIKGGSGGGGGKMEDGTGSDGGGKSIDGEDGRVGKWWRRWRGNDDDGGDGGVTNDDVGASYLEDRRKQVSLPNKSSKEGRTKSFQTGKKMVSPPKEKSR